MGYPAVGPLAGGQDAAGWLVLCSRRLRAACCISATPAYSPYLSLPYVPGRLVIEVSDPAADARWASGPPPDGQLALVRDLPGHERQDSGR